MPRETKQDYLEKLRLSDLNLDVAEKDLAKQRAERILAGETTADLDQLQRSINEKREIVKKLRVEWSNYEA